jgi:hypothetical protein
MVSVTATVVWYRFRFLWRIELAGQVDTKVRFSLNVMNMRVKGINVTPVTRKSSP